MVLRAGSSGDHRLRGELDDTGFEIGDVLVERGRHGPRLGPGTRETALRVCDAELRQCDLGVGATASDLPGDPTPLARHGIRRNLDVDTPHAVANLGDTTAAASPPIASGCGFRRDGHEQDLRKGTHPASGADVATVHRDSSVEMALLAARSRAL